MPSYVLYSWPSLLLRQKILTGYKVVLKAGLISACFPSPVLSFHILPVLYTGPRLRTRLCGFLLRSDPLQRSSGKYYHLVSEYHLKLFAPARVFYSGYHTGKSSIRSPASASSVLPKGNI